MDHEIVQVTVTAPSAEVAGAIARSTVERRLAACVQVSGPITSTYRWKGEVETAEEWIALLKTTRRQVDRLIGHVTDIHPYEVPEVIVSPVVAGNQAYLRWVSEETST